MSLCAALDLVAYICGTGKSETAAAPTPKKSVELSSEDLKGLHSLSGGAQAQQMPADLKADIVWAEQMRSRAKRRP